MSYHTILVSINDIKSSLELIKSAVLLAKKHDAHLIGLHVTTALDVPSFAGTIDFPDSVYEDHRVASEQRASLVQGEFESATKREQVSSEWHTVTSMTTQIGHKVVDHARCVDLAIVAQGDEEGAENGQLDLPEQLLMESGRPVLIIPNKAEIRSIGDYPLLAWNGSRESSRAAFDAIPVFQDAKEVQAVSISSKHSDSDSDLAGSEIATALSRYGINIKTSHVITGGKRVDECIFSKIKDSGADLLVMGGYGRSRLREYVFGGVTRRILKNMSVPVLMSH